MWVHVDTALGLNGSWPDTVCSGSPYSNMFIYWNWFYSLCIENKMTLSILGHLKSSALAITEYHMHENIFQYLYTWVCVSSLIEIRSLRKRRPQQKQLQNRETSIDLFMYSMNTLHRNCGLGFGCYVCLYNLQAEKEKNRRPGGNVRNPIAGLSHPWKCLSTRDSSII